ncbi:MAG: alpha/beta family hydrolase [Calditrichia bacterium]
METVQTDIDLKRKIELGPPEKEFPDRPLLILAHGAGNDMFAPFMMEISRRIESYRLNVLRFNFPYKTAGRKMPDSQKILELAWRSAIDWAADNLKFEGLFIGGKSLGARIASMIAGDISGLSGLVFLGYPLHPPGRYDNRRDEHLYRLKLPMLFIQGSNDAFAKIDLLLEVVEKLKPFVSSHFIEEGDHSYRVPAKSGRKYEDILAEAGDVAARWIMEIWGNK